MKGHGSLKMDEIHDEFQTYMSIIHRPYEYCT